MISQKYPTTIEAFAKSGWIKKLNTLVFKFHLNEPVEDTVQDILMKMIETDYLSTWEPSKGSYSNWVYTLALNHCRKYYRRSNTKGGKAIEGAAAIEADSKNDEFIPGVVRESTLGCADAFVESSIFIEELTELVSTKFTAHSSHEFDGVVYNREPGTVFKLIIHEDLDPKEVAERFGTSVEFVYSLIRKLRPIIKRELEPEV